MADALSALDKLNRQIAALTRVVNSGRSKHITVASVQPTARAIATLYFELVRTELDSVKVRGGLVDEIDFVIQQILQLTASSREKQAYIGQLNELRPLVLEATIDLMRSLGKPRLILSEIERAILETLTKFLPAAAASYEQALRDVSEGGRCSWRGTATELRETLRDVIDHFAPDEKVSTASGFRYEVDQKRPTQKQKVRFILKARRSSGAAVAVAQASLETVEEAVAALARSTYQRGSVSTHIGSNHREIKNLKRYVDALLAELLEVN